jgi:SAM-dependent methyltransferase
MPARDAWLDALWPQVRRHLPAPPATVVEIGCGSRGGFVPALQRDGYDALGIDPAAPEGPAFRRVEFEKSELPARADAIVACTSLHHVADPTEVVARVAGHLRPGGVVIVVEWDWQRFDEATAQWCFARLGSGDGGSWLHHRRDSWVASGESWPGYFSGWAAGHGLHTWERLRRELDQHFQPVACRAGPLFFGDLADTSPDDELKAIEAGEIRANRVDYVGTLADR